jgi:hypothetical protein
MRYKCGAIGHLGRLSEIMLDLGGAVFHDKHVRGIKAKRVQVDEIWSFTAAKQKNVAAMKKSVDGAGDTWTWTALEADTETHYLVFRRRPR